MVSFYNILILFNIKKKIVFFINLNQNYFKKMSKKSPEDAFYNNLLLGLNSTLSIKKIQLYNLQKINLIDILANVPRVCNVTMEKRTPCEKSNVMTWEQRHGVYLPEDMKKFYMSTDGFLLHWSYQYARKSTQ